MFKKVLFLLLTFAIPVLIFAQSSGKIMGVIHDKETGEPLPGVNVILQGTFIGATTDVDGYYVILNVPAGLFNLEATYVGYQKVVITELRVSAGITTEQNIELQPMTLEIGEAIIVVAERPLVDKHVTHSVSKVNSEDLKDIPVRGIQNILAVQPSVVVQDGNVHIRGGRTEEVGYYLDGASTMDPVSRTNAVHVIQEAVEEMQILTGGFTAQFGDANSGIILTDLKTGGADFHFSFDAQTDKLVSEGEEFLGTYSYRDHIITATASGPIMSKKYRYFLAVENENIGDTRKRFSKGFDFYNKVDTHPYNKNVIAGTPDTIDIHYPDGFTPRNERDRWAVNGTMLFNFDPIRFRMSGVYNWNRTYSSGSPMLNILNDRQVYTDYNHVLLTGKITHVINPTTYYDVKINYFHNESETNDPYFGNEWISWRDSAKVYDHTNGRVVFRDAWNTPYPYKIHGFDFVRDGYIGSYTHTKQTYYGGAADLVTQIGKHNEVRAGLSGRLYTIRRFNIAPDVMETINAGKPLEPGQSMTDVDPQIWRRYVGTATYGYDIYGEETDKGFDGPKQPIFLNIYAQDKIEYKDLIINAGLRFDYFDTDDRILKNPNDPEVDAVNGLILESEWEDKDAQMFVSPRLGISFPVSEKTVFYTQYGKFVQMPEFNDIYYSARDYGRQIYTGGYYYGGNPVGFDLGAIRTTSYEVGFRQQIGDNAAFDISGFYRNVKGQIQIERVDPAVGSEIAQYLKKENGDFGTTKGLELKLTLRRINRIQAQLSYTLTDAEGTGSSELSYVAAVYRVTQRPTLVTAMEFSQTHRGAINLDYRFGKGDGGPVLEQLGFNMLFSFNSGHPYTVVEDRGGQANPYNTGIHYMSDTRSRWALEPVNASETPWNFNFDLRIDKSFDIKDMIKATVYCRINNLFNTKNAINVYPNTGSARDDGFYSDPRAIQDFYDSYGGDDYLALYKAINVENGSAYWTETGRQLYGHPRQIFFGIKITY